MFVLNDFSASPNCGPSDLIGWANAEPIKRSKLLQHLNITQPEIPWKTIMSRSESYTRTKAFKERHRKYLTPVHPTLSFVPFIALAGLHQSEHRKDDGRAVLLEMKPEAVWCKYY